MLKGLVLATCLAVGAGSAVYAEPVSVDPPIQSAVKSDGTVLNRLASNKLASNRLASNKLASNRLASNRLASNRLAQNGAVDITPLVTIVAVTLADGTRLEVPASR